MDDEIEPGLSRDNIRSLTFYLGVEMDRRLAELREETAFASVRPADARILVIASRKVATLSEIARTAGITRQAVHISVQRLQDAGLLTLSSRDGDKREKSVVLTPAAWEGIRLAEIQIRRTEDEIARAIGREGLELLRSYLKMSLRQLRDGASGSLAATPKL